MRSYLGEAQHGAVLPTRWSVPVPPTGVTSGRVLRLGHDGDTTHISLVNDVALVF